MKGVDKLFHKTSFHFWLNAKVFLALLDGSEFCAPAFALERRDQDSLRVWLCLLLRESGHSGKYPSQIFFFYLRSGGNCERDFSAPALWT